MDLKKGTGTFDLLIALGLCWAAGRSLWTGPVRWGHHRRHRTNPTAHTSRLRGADADESNSTTRRTRSANETRDGPF